MVAAFALVLTLTIVGVTAFAGAEPRNSAVTAVNGSGRKLGANPVVRAGEHLVVTVIGFAPHAEVMVRSSWDGTDHGLDADPHGVARLRFTVPSGLAVGSYALTFVGAPAPHGRVPAGNVVVTVPLVARFAFRVRASGHDDGHGVRGVTTQRPGGHSSSPLANTGVDVAATLTVVAVALGVGVGVNRAGRRRRRAGES